MSYRSYYKLIQIFTSTDFSFTVYASIRSSEVITELKLLNHLFKTFYSVKQQCMLDCVLAEYGLGMCSAELVKESAIKTWC